MVETTSLKRRRGRPPSGETPGTDEDYLRAALAAFAELGFEGSSMRQVAKFMGVSHGLLNAKFGSKEQLWTAAVDQEMTRLSQRIETAAQSNHDESDLVSRLTATFVDILLAIAECPGLLKLMNQEGARGGDRLDYIASKFFRTASIEKLIREGQAKGIFKEAAPALIYIVLAHGGGALFALGPLTEKFGLRNEAGEDGLRQRANLVANILVSGLTRDTSAGRRSSGKRNSADA